MEKYLPEDKDASIADFRKKTHKVMWRMLKSRDFQSFFACMDKLNKQGVPFDEITYNFAIFGSLINPRIDDNAAREVLSNMVAEKRFDPSLLRLQAGFLESYFMLKEVDATPNSLNLQRVARTFWQVSVNFKHQRMKLIRAKLADAAAAQREQAASSLLLEQGIQDDTELVGDEGVVAQKESTSRPFFLKGVFKGSGIRNRRRRSRQLWKRP